MIKKGWTLCSSSLRHENLFAWKAFFCISSFIHKHILIFLFLSHLFSVIFQLASIISSLIYISWSLASYHRAVRRCIPSKRKMSVMAIILQILWRFFTLTSRLVAIGLFISAYSYWILPIAIGHWGVMTIWIMHQGTSFCRSEQLEYLFNMIIGTVYLFCLLNIKDEPTRYKYSAYYVIVFIENTLFIALWYMKVTSHSLSSIIGVGSPSPMQSITVNHTALAIASGVFGSFFAGIVFMLLYYRFFHPNGRPLWANKAAKCCWDFFIHFYFTPIIQLELYDCKWNSQHFLVK